MLQRDDDEVDPKRKQLALVYDSQEPGFMEMPKKRIHLWESTEESVPLNAIPMSSNLDEEDPFDALLQLELQSTVKVLEKANDHLTEDIDGFIADLEEELPPVYEEMPPAEDEAEMDALVREWEQENEKLVIDPFMDTRQKEPSTPRIGARLKDAFPAQESSQVVEGTGSPLTRRESLSARQSPIPTATEESESYIPAAPKKQRFLSSKDDFNKFQQSTELPHLQVKSVDGNDTFSLPLRLFKASAPPKEDSFLSNKVYSMLRNLDLQKESTSLPPKMHSTTPQTQLWVDKYSPKKYSHLLSNDEINRQVLQWLTQWRPCVFGEAAQQEKNVSDPLRRPDKKLLLISGPPGLGKTTLAHIIGDAAGYRVMELNASDDRTGSSLKQRILAAVESRHSLLDKRPVLLVLDEIDGAASSGQGDSNLCQLLISLANGGANSVTDSVENKPTRKKHYQLLRRPIICICNDLYAPVLRVLRNHAMICQIKKPSMARMTARLRAICQQEKLSVDSRALVALCEWSEFDIRSCLNTLQFMSHQGHAVTLSTLSQGMCRKDIQMSGFALLDQILQSPVRESDQGFIHRLNSLLQQQQDSDWLIQACFENYLQLKFHDPLKKIISIHDWLYFSQRIQSKIQSRQLFELSQYANVVILAFHSMFATTKKTMFQLPQFQQHQLLQQNTHILQSLHQGMHLGQQMLLSLTTLRLDILDPLTRLIVPQLRHVNPQLLKTHEKMMLRRLIDILLSFGISFRQIKAEHGTYVYQWEPPLDKVLLVQRNTALYAVKQLVAQELEKERLRRVEGNKKSESIAPLAVPNVKKVKVTEKVAVDFFGRPLKQENHGSAMSQSLETGSTVFWWYKHNEGYSNAVLLIFPISESESRDFSESHRFVTIMTGSSGQHPFARAHAVSSSSHPTPRPARRIMNKSGETGVDADAASSDGHSSSSEENECPLCMETMDLTDRYFKPCPCGYQICRFCWHHIRESLNGRCPACRREYSDEPVSFTPLHSEKIQQLLQEKKNREKQRKLRQQQQLQPSSNTAIRPQRFIVYVMGLPVRLLQEEILSSEDYFGQFGKVTKVAVARARLPTSADPESTTVTATSNAASHDTEESTTAPNSAATRVAYVTFLKREEAQRAIQSLDETHFAGRTLYVGLGSPPVPRILLVVTEQRQISASLGYGRHGRKTFHERKEEVGSLPQHERKEEEIGTNSVTRQGERKEVSPNRKEIQSDNSVSWAAVARHAVGESSTNQIEHLQQQQENTLHQPEFYFQQHQEPAMHQQHELHPQQQNQPPQQPSLSLESLQQSLPSWQPWSMPPLAPLLFHTTANNASAAPSTAFMNSLMTSPLSPSPSATTPTATTATASNAFLPHWARYPLQQQQQQPLPSLFDPFSNTTNFISSLHGLNGADLSGSHLNSGNTNTLTDISSRQPSPPAAVPAFVPIQATSSNISNTSFNANVSTISNSNVSNSNVKVPNANVSNNLSNASAPSHQRATNRSRFEFAQKEETPQSVDLRALFPNINVSFAETSKVPFEPTESASTIHASNITPVSKLESSVADPFAFILAPEQAVSTLLEARKPVSGTSSPVEEKSVFKSTALSEDAMQFFRQFLSKADENQSQQQHPASAQSSSTPWQDPAIMVAVGGSSGNVEEMATDAFKRNGSNSAVANASRRILARNQYRKDVLDSSSVNESSDVALEQRRSRTTRWTATSLPKSSSSSSSLSGGVVSPPSEPMARKNPHPRRPVSAPVTATSVPTSVTSAPNVPTLAEKDSFNILDSKKLIGRLSSNPGMKPSLKSSTFKRNDANQSTAVSLTPEIPVHNNASVVTTSPVPTMHRTRRPPSTKGYSNSTSSRS